MYEGTIRKKKLPWKYTAQDERRVPFHPVCKSPSFTSNDKEGKEANKGNYLATEQVPNLPEARKESYRKYCGSTFG